jgi:hypothetical protein
MKERTVTAKRTDVKGSGPPGSKREITLYQLSSTALAIWELEGRSRPLSTYISQAMEFLLSCRVTLLAYDEGRANATGEN